MSALLKKADGLIDKRWIRAFFLLGVAFIASLPAFRSGVYNGHDIKFHLGRIQAIAQELSAGNFPVRYESQAWYGHGYVCTTYYGNIFLYIPALLYMVGLPVYRAYNIYVILVNLVTVFLSYYSFKSLFRDRGWGMLATLIYMLAGYRLTNLYVRAAVGEYTAMAFIPLVIYGVYRIYNHAGFSASIIPQSRINSGDAGRVEATLHAILPRAKRVLPLVLGATGLIESHVLTTELMAVFVFIFVILNIRQIRYVIKDLLFSLVLILGLNLFFIVPFIDSYTSMDLNINSTFTTESIRGDGLYLSQIFGLLTQGAGSSFMWTAEDEGCYNIGLPVLICFGFGLAYLLFILIKRIRGRNIQHARHLHWIATLFVFGLIAAWLSTIYFPWDYFTGDGIINRLMTSVQYPWRYLMVQTTCYIIVGVYAMKELLHTVSWTLVIAIAFVICLGTTAYFDYTLSYRNLTLYNVDAEEDWADSLYLISGTDRSRLQETDSYTAYGQLVLPVLAYDNIHVYTADGTEQAISISENNCIAVEYLGDAADLVVRFVEPISWRVSEMISAIFIIGVIVLTVKNRMAFNGDKI